MIILFGAGNCGRSIARRLKAEGKTFVFVDNDTEKQHTVMMDVPVLNPQEALSDYPDAKWIAAIGKPERKEVIEQLASLGIKAEEPWEYLDMKMGLPPKNIRDTLFPAVFDGYSKMEFNDQCQFRREPDYDYQLKCDDLADIYWPGFITHLDEEVFIDCGAADGDTVKEFMLRWDNFESIVAFEPDQSNYNKLIQVENRNGKVTCLRFAVADFDGEMSFSSLGDYSSRLGEGSDKVRVCILDKILGDVIPTYIKADIEGSELEMIWGARRILKEHSPVLAICAYHTSDHIWQIPLLINAIQPNYILFLRRYSLGTMDTVWYAVPPERIK